MNMIEIYCDGSCSWRNKRGGIGVVIIEGDKIKEISEGAFYNTTISQMELLAIIIGMEKIKDKNQCIKIYSDSEYVTNMINKKWLKNWHINDFLGKKNKELLETYWYLYQQFSDLEIIHVRGHQGIEGNELADKLAKKGYNNI